ncbi:MAG TPA: protein phosphatase 2C domain-containing protein [Gammaproteobacteria bacterium]
MKYDISKASRLGNRKSNQDRMGVVENRHAVLLVVADGLGGHAGGDLAAETVVDCAIRLFNSAAHPIQKPALLINEIFLRAQRDVLSLANARTPPIQARSTCVVCIIQDGFACWGHLGDSRLYVIRNQAVVTRTIDHSRVENLFQQGLITEQEKSNHPDKNLITRCIGSENHRPQPTISVPFPLERNDVILLCSDGFWSPLPDQDLINGVQKQNFNDVIEDLTSDAEETSYPNSDNISVIGFRWLDVAPQSAVKQNPLQGAARDADEVSKEVDAMLEKLQQIVNK